MKTSDADYEHSMGMKYQFKKNTYSIVVRDKFGQINQSTRWQPFDAYIVRINQSTRSARLEFEP